MESMLNHDHENSSKNNRNSYLEPNFDTSNEEEEECDPPKYPKKKEEALIKGLVLDILLPKL